LTTKLLSRFKQQIRELKLIPSSGGCFELTVNGQLVYSKLEAGKFPDEQWAVDAVEARSRNLQKA
jgi:selenoprotein W-related protein